MTDTERSGRVVVGVDDSLSGLQALRRAVAEARARGMPLHAVRAWRPDPRSHYPTLEDQHEVKTSAASQLVAQAFADAMGGLPIDVEVETVLVPDLPGPSLLRHDVTRYCLAHVTCPVLVVPPPSLTRAASTRTLLRELRRDIDQFAGGGA